MAPARNTAKAPLDAVISELNAKASALAVYASSAGLLRARRKTRFWLLAKLYQAGLVTRRVPTKGFQDASYISSSFPKLSWRRLRPLFMVLFMVSGRHLTFNVTSAADCSAR